MQIKSSPVDTGAVLVVDPDVLPFITQPSVIALAQLRLSLLCIALCTFRIKISALQHSIITPNLPQMSGLVLNDVLSTSWYSPLAYFAFVPSVLM